jgi:IS605 OrfB family transposase
VLKRAKSVQGGVLTNSGGGRVVGVDLGQKALATLSTGVRFSGGELKGKRLHYLGKRAEVRSKLDTQRTKGVKRLWERLSGRERRFVNHTLHTLARRIVDGLEPGDTLAIEDLNGLRDRTTQRGKETRHIHNLWPYARLRFLLEYKAALKGVRVVAVDPHHTSQECPRCGHTARENRKGQALFRCQRCGFQHNEGVAVGHTGFAGNLADWVVSVNIALRAVPQGIVAQRAGSMGMGRCKPARILRVPSVHRLPSESPRL